MQELQKIREDLQKRKREHLMLLQRLVEQPSISAHGEGVRECASLLRNMMEEMGISARLYETKGEPVVYGEAGPKQAGFPTVLFYGHYDVQPPEPLDAWDSPPFKPAVRGGRLYGRGTGDNKGQLLCHILAVGSILRVKGQLPLRVKIILEGEEESGSPHLAEFVEENRELLSCDLVYTSDGPLHESGSPTVLFGVRGMLGIELNLRTATSDNHSGNKGGVIPNAAWEMVRVLSKLQDDKGKILVPGFYQHIREPGETERELVARMDFAPEEIARNFSVKKIELEKEEFYRRLTLEPTMSINGLKSGYQGEGTKTIIPAEATAKLDFRLVAEQDPREISAGLTEYIHSLNPDVQVTEQGYMFPSRTDPGLPVCQKVLEAMEEICREKPVALPAAGGSLPDYVWTKILGVPSVIVPYANADEANHAPNENLELDCFYRGIEISAGVISKLGEGD